MIGELQPWHRIAMDMWEKDKDELTFEAKAAETAVEELIQIVMDQIKIIAEPDHCKQALTLLKTEKRQQ